MKEGTLILLLIGMLSTCRADQAALSAVSQGNNKFSVELYDAIRKGKSNENLIVSPLSVATVMGMLQAGARGSTADLIRKSLHFPADDQLNSGYQALLQQLRSDDSVTLEMANKIYPKVGFTLNPSFADTLKTYFSAEPQQLDFEKSQEAAGAINNFVQNATRDRIRDLVSPDDFDSLTRLVLVNAIYFKGNWKHQFPKKDTTKREFHVSEGKTVDVDMMHLETDLLYADISELNAKAVSLPYKGDRLSMIILLPNEMFGLAALEEKLKNYPLEQIIDKMRERKVQLYLPKFKLESTIDLKDPLTTLGLGQLFDQSQADLTGIAKEKEQLYVSKAIQKAFIEVNEEGSEAAAATGFGVQSRSGFVQQPITVMANHGFVSIIREDVDTKSPLFMAAVLDPQIEKTSFRSLIGEENSATASASIPALSSFVSLFPVLVLLFVTLFRTH